MSLFLNIIFTLILYVKMDIVLEWRIKSKKIHYIMYFIFLIFNYGGILILESISASLASVYMIIIYLGFLIFFYKNKISEKILFMLVTINLLLLICIFTLYIILVIGYISDGNIEFLIKMDNIFIIISGLIFNIVEIKSLKYWKKGYFFSFTKNKKNRKYVYGTLILSLIGIITYVISNNVIEENEKNMLIFGYLTMIFIFVIVILYLIKFKNKILYYLVENESLEMEVKAINEENIQLKEYDKNKKIIWHDIKKHNFIINQLIKENKVDEAMNYLEKINTEINNSEKMRITENIIVNSLVNLKMHECEKNNIPYDININLPKKMNIESFHLTIIIGNILDNAIEENKRLEKFKRYIDIYSEIKRNKWILIVENSCRIKEGLTEKDLKTSKKISRDHGLGIRSIKKAIKEYSGEIVFENENYKFKTIVYIPLEKGDRNA